MKIREFKRIVKGQPTTDWAGVKLIRVLGRGDHIRHEAGKVLGDCAGRSCYGRPIPSTHFIHLLTQFGGVR